MVVVVEHQYLSQTTHDNGGVEGYTTAAQRPAAGLQHLEGALEPFPGPHLKRDSPADFEHVTD